MIEIQTVTAADYHKLAAYFADFPGEKRTSEEWLHRFNHWWEGNPAFTSDHVRGVILKDNEQIVGYNGNFPSLLLIDGVETVALNGSSWRVQEKYRQYSMELYYQNRILAKDKIFFNTTPVSSILKLLKVHKFKLIPWGDEQESFLPLKISLKINSSGLNSGLTFLICRIADYCWKKYLKFAVFLRSSKQRFKWQLIPEPGPEFDDLWLRTKNKFANTNVRNRKCVHWYSRGKILFGCYHDNILTGYALFLPYGSGNLNKFRLVDLWLENIDHVVIRELIRFGISYCLQNDFDLIYFPHFTKELVEHFNQMFLRKHRITRMNFFSIPIRIEDQIHRDKSYFVTLQGDYGM